MGKEKGEIGEIVGRDSGESGERVEREWGEIVVQLSQNAVHDIGLNP